MKIKQFIGAMLTKTGTFHVGLIFMGIPFLWAEPIALNFDSLFPENPYIQVLNGCKKICGDLDAFDLYNCSQEEFMQFNGTLFNALQIIHNDFAGIFNYKNLLPVEDATYLAHVVGQIEWYYKNLFGDVAKDQQLAVLASLANLKSKADSLLIQGR